MASGVKVGDDVVTAYDKFKMANTTTCKYVTFKITDDMSTIVVDKEGGQPTDGYEVFYDYMKEMDDNKQCRYATVCVNYDVGTTKRSKIVFITFIPENSKIKHKMLYTASKQELKKKLEGADPEIQANDLEDITVEAVKADIQRKFKS